MSENETRFVTHAEFQGFRDDFRRFQDDVKDTFDAIQTLLSEKNKTNWSVVLAGLGTVLVMLGMGAALAGFLLSAEADARQAADNATRELVDLMVQRGQGEISENAHELDLMWQLWFNQLEQNGASKERLTRVNQHVLDEVRRHALEATEENK